MWCRQWPRTLSILGRTPFKMSEQGQCMVCDGLTGFRCFGSCNRWLHKHHCYRMEAEGSMPHVYCKQCFNQHRPDGCVHPRGEVLPCFCCYCCSAFANAQLIVPLLVLFFADVLGSLGIGWPNDSSESLSSSTSSPPHPRSSPSSIAAASSVHGNDAAPSGDGQPSAKVAKRRRGTDLVGRGKKIPWNEDLDLAVIEAVRRFLAQTGAETVRRGQWTTVVKFLIEVRPDLATHSNLASRAAVRFDRVLKERYRRALPAYNAATSSGSGPMRHASYLVCG